MKKVLIVTGMLIMNGCALLNPYESSFSCPETSKGKCVSVQNAYSESAISSGKIAEAAAESKIDDRGIESAAAGGCSDGKMDESLHSTSRENSNYNSYRTALFDKFSGLLKDPVTPIVVPPDTMRVLLLPYTGQDNEFYMLRYVYFFVDEPHWLLGDSVSSAEEE